MNPGIIAVFLVVVLVILAFSIRGFVKKAREKKQEQHEEKSL